MKKIFKKNQVIITALAIMIAVAGYINYSDNHLGLDKTLKKASTEAKDKNVTETADTDGIQEEIDSLDYDLTDETALLEENTAAGDTKSAEDSKATQDTQKTEETKTDSSAASSETPGEAVLTGSSNFVAQAKVNREQVRSENKETLLEIINNANLGDAQKQDAIASMVNMTNMAEQESAAEMLLEAKGFQNVVVNLTGDSADIIVPQNYMDDANRAQIEDIVKRKTSVPVENIVLTPMEEGTSNGE